MSTRWLSGLALVLAGIAAMISLANQLLLSELKAQISEISATQESMTRTQLVPAAEGFDAEPAQGADPAERLQRQEIDTAVSAVVDSSFTQTVSEDLALQSLPDTAKRLMEKYPSGMVTVSYRGSEEVIDIGEPIDITDMPVLQITPGEVINIGEPMPVD